MHLTGEKETLLITLYARALDYRSKDSILNDSKADEIMRAIDYDFERLRGFGNGNVIVARARQLDEWLKEFLESSPNAIVLNVGCGLDTRVSRMNPPAGIGWFDVDYPEVIKERRNFYSDREGYQMIESSITEPGWMDEVPSGRPVIVTADGVMEYLTAENVRTFLRRVTDRFPSGQVAFDVMNSFAVRSGKSDLKRTTGAEHKWAVDNIREVDELNPMLRRVDNITVLWSKYFPLEYRLLYGVAGLFPSFRNMIRLLRYEF